MSPPLVSLMLAVFASTIAVDLMTICSANTIEVEGPAVTPWGDYGPWGACPPNSYVYGVRLSVEDKQGAGDDTALNDIELYCRQGFGGSGGSHGSQRLRFEEVVQVPRAHGDYGGCWGKWRDKFTCPEKRDTFVTGIQLRIESQQGAGDDTAANDVRLVCSNGDVVDGNGAPWGKWRDPITCPPGLRVCGMRTKIEKYRGSGTAFGKDDTAVNTIDIMCC